MRILKSHRNRAYTLIELAAAMAVILLVGFISTQLTATAMQTSTLARRASQMAGEAQVIQSILQRLLLEAEFYTVHTSYADAQSGNSPVVVLQPTQQTGNSWQWVRVTYPPASIGGLNPIGVIGFSGSTHGFYWRGTGGAWPTVPSWYIARNLSNVLFDPRNMILTTRLQWGTGGDMIALSVLADPL